MRSIYRILIVAFFMCNLVVLSQVDSQSVTPSLEWVREYTSSVGEGWDYASYIDVQDNGDILVIGTYNSPGWLWFFKINPMGDIIFNQKYGGDVVNFGFDVVEKTQNGDYLIAGWGDNATISGLELNVFFIEKDGDEKWNRSYSNLGIDLEEDDLKDISETQDGSVLCLLSYGAGIVQS